MIERVLGGNALAVGDAVQELVERHLLRLAARAVAAAAQRRAELGRQHRREFVGLAPGDPLRQRLQRGRQRPLGAVAIEARAALDAVDQLLERQRLARHRRAEQRVIVLGELRDQLAELVLREQASARNTARTCASAVAGSVSSRSATRRTNATGSSGCASPCGCSQRRSATGSRPARSRATPAETRYVDQLTSGRGPLGSLERHYDVVERARRAVSDDAATRLLGGAGMVLSITRGIVGFAVGMVTIGFLTRFMLLEGPAWVERGLEAMPESGAAAAAAWAAGSARRCPAMSPATY
jgi:hypothetical protein